MAPITSAAHTSRNFKFSSFPTELRLMVWEATFEPRILHITSETTYLPNPQKPRFYGCCRRVIPNHIRFKSREKPPIALQICHESRTLALKYYIPSFQSSTSPLSRASEMKQTALYFNRELDTVHVACRQYTYEFNNLSYRTLKETIQSIKVLAIGSQLFEGSWMGQVARCLPEYESLETLILVASGEMGGEGDGSSVRVNMENALVEAQNQLVSQGNCKEQKLPVVKVMALQAFENHL